jgi:hypothetical protein
MKADIEKMVADHEGGGYPAAVKSRTADLPDRRSADVQNAQEPNG